MTAVYDKLGLKFLYPENWTLIDESDTEVPHAITLETPGGGSSWTVHVYDRGSDRDSIIKETLATLQDTYEDLEIAAFEEALGAYEARGVEAMFYCLDFLIRARLVFVNTQEHLLLFWFQAEDREFEKQDAVFKALSISLLQSQTPES